MEIRRTENPKQIPEDAKEFKFGQSFTDHMLTIDFNSATGWA